MALTVINRRVGRLLLAFVLGLASVGLTATYASAASPAVTAPIARVTFLQDITFTGGATLTTDVVRVEIVVDIEGATRSIAAEIPTGVTNGSASLSWVLDTPGGGLLPNTSVTARFRLTLADGTSVEGASTSVRYDDTRFVWKTVTGDFATVHWVDGGQAFGLKAMRISDAAIRAVSTLLGVTESDPIDFYVYGDRTAFYEVLGAGTRENVGGEAHPDIRTLFANISPDAVDDPWVGVVIPHELTHLIFDSAVRNAYHYPFRWLNEGIAVYLSEGYGSRDRSAVESAVEAGTVMPLRALGGEFPTTRERFFLAYSESVAAVSFLVDRYGRDAMVKLVRSYGHGVSDDEAFTAALGVDVVAFEAAWLESIGAQAPNPYGPQPAPVGPIPADWAGAASTPGSVAAPSPSLAASLPGGSIPDGAVDASGAPVLALTVAAFAIVMVALRTRRRSTRRALTGMGAAAPGAGAAPPDTDSLPPETASGVPDPASDLDAAQAKDGEANE